MRRLSLSVFFVLTLLSYFSYNIFAQNVESNDGVEEEKPDIKILKIKRERTKEEHPYIERQKIDNVRYFLKYRVRSRNAKKAFLNTYIMRKRRDKIIAYKKEDSLMGRYIERGTQEKELTQEFEDGEHTRERHGEIVKIRVEVWYPDTGGTLLAALEEPKPRPKKKKKAFGLMQPKQPKKEKAEILWWEKVEYGEYF